MFSSKLGCTRTQRLLTQLETESPLFNEEYKDDEDNEDDGDDPDFHSSGSEEEESDEEDGGDPDFQNSGSEELGRKMAQSGTGHSMWVEYFDRPGAFPKSQEECTDPGHNGLECCRDRCQCRLSDQVFLRAQQHSRLLCDALNPYQEVVPRMFVSEVAEPLDARVVAAHEQATLIAHSLACEAWAPCRTPQAQALRERHTCIHAHCLAGPSA